MKLVDVLIIGSGFSASEVNKSLDQSISRLIVDVSHSYRVDSDEESLFSPKTMSRNAKSGGGITEWGGAISDLEDAGVSSAPDNLEFNNLMRTLDLNPKTYFGRFTRPNPLRTAIARAMSKFLLGSMANRFHLNVGAYSSPIRGGYGPDKSPISFHDLPPVQVATLQELRYDANRQSILFKYLDAYGASHLVSARRVVFASSAIGNAFLVHHLTGQKDFPIGNHVSRVAASVVFTNLRYLGALVQEWRPNDTEFFTLNLRHLDKGSSETTQASVRLFAWDVSRSDSSAGSSIAARILKRIRLYPGVNIQVMQVLEPGKTANLKIAQDGKRGRVMPSSGILGNLMQVSKELLEVLEAGIASRGIFTMHEDAFSDAAHYFGTVPVTTPEKRSEELGVDSNFLLHGFERVYVVGLSAMPRISHAHPTIFALASGRKVGAHIGLVRETNENS